MRKNVFNQDVGVKMQYLLIPVEVLIQQLILKFKC